MKNFFRLLPFLVIGMVFCFPTVSNAQKKCVNKKNKSIPCPTKTSEKPVNNPVVSKKSQPIEDKWQTLKIEECGFSVEFPAKPQKRVDGEGLGPTWFITLPTARYRIACDPMDRESLLYPNAYLQSMVLYFPGEVANKEYFNVSALPGVQGVRMAGTSNDEMITVEQVYVVPRREVSVMIVAASTKDDVQKNSESVKRFIGSLKLF